MERILLVDDDEDLCRLVERVVRRAGYEIDVASSGEAGWRLLTRQTYELVILDVQLPGMDGLALLAQLREQSAVPVLMLTARNGEQDKVEGLLGGADDYLGKPFGLDELLARIQAQIRRYTVLKGAETPLVMQFRELSINVRQQEVVVRGQRADLSGREVQLLALLAAEPGRVWTKRQLYQRLWPEEEAFDEGNMMAFISKLRKKIEPGETPYYIQTVRGVGYRFNKEAVL